MRNATLPLQLIVMLSTLAIADPLVWSLRDENDHITNISLHSNPIFGLILIPELRTRSPYYDPKHNFAISKKNWSEYDKLNDEARNAILYGRLLYIGSQYASERTQIPVETIQSNLSKDQALQLSVASLLQHRVKRKNQGAVIAVLSLVVGNSLMTYSAWNRRLDRTWNTSLFVSGIATIISGAGLGYYRFAATSDNEEERLIDAIHSTQVP